MQWLNLNVATLDSEEFVFSTPVEQSVWLNVQRYCISQENGGVIPGARGWTSRQWQQVVRVPRKDVQRESRLWEWRADDLVVKFYPHSSQLEVQAKRRGAIQRHAQRAAQQPAEQGADLGAEQADKEREGKEREKKGKESGARPRALHVSEGEIPTCEACLQWGQTAGVPEDWIRAKHTVTTGTHGWVRNGQMIQWQTLWQAWFADKPARPRSASKRSLIPREGPISPGLWDTAEKNSGEKHAVIDWLPRVCGGQSFGGTCTCPR
jgi:hypothetical protein